MRLFKGKSAFDALYATASKFYIGGTAMTASAADLNKIAGAATAGAPVLAMSSLITEITGDAVYTVTHTLPAGSYVVDVQVHGIALWTASTSATMVVGDAGSANGFYTSTNLKATDLLAGEVNCFEHPGGLAGSYIASEQRVLYSATARTILYVATKVGTGTAGRTRCVTYYCTPADIAAVRV